MAIRNILTSEDPALRRKCRPVETIDVHIHELLDDMVETLHTVKGLGLAAPQVGVLRRVIIVEIEGELIELVNPCIVKQKGEQVADEGCLSIPTSRGLVRRPAKIMVEGLDRYGNPVSYRASGYAACVFCHEIDHLDGILFTDKLVPPEEIKA